MKHKYKKINKMHTQKHVGKKNPIPTPFIYRQKIHNNPSLLDHYKILFNIKIFRIKNLKSNFLLTLVATYLNKY